MTDLLWSTEDELRTLCRELWIRLMVADAVREFTNQEAMEHGYREGYARAVIQISATSEMGDAKGHTVH